ncbi:MAG TPA: enoyl-CoA hydratase/isomerase family protein [Candidatus Thermoplasmatota archaeon]|nr:enoyl-CoA hydratase/isomerase family protein [Candidatus Thermoplasmatota archaeon]
MTEYKNIKLKVDEHTAILTLSHPPVNALSPAMLKEISQALDELTTQKNVRALIITASGSNAFCAGADIKEVASAGPGGAAEIVSLGHETFSKLENFRAPTIAAINNLTLGGGLELALACDIRISSDRARFGFPEVTLGLIPSWG